MKLAASLALCLVAGLAVLHCGAAESYYQQNSYDHGGSYQQKGCMKENVGGKYQNQPGYGIRKEQGFVLVGSQFFTCIEGYKPAYGSQAKATCQPTGYWTIDIDCKKEEYSYGGSSYNSKPYESKPYDSKPYDSKPYDSKPYDSKPYDSKPYDSKSYDSKSYNSKPYNKDNSYSSGNSYSGSYKSGVLRPWGQCGGKSAECYNGVGPCVDAVWTNVYCPSGQKCYRQSEYYYQCLPESNNNYNSNYQPPKTNNYGNEYKPKDSYNSYNQQQVYGRL